MAGQEVALAGPAASAAAIMPKATSRTSMKCRPHPHTATGGGERISTNYPVRGLVVVRSMIPVGYTATVSSSSSRLQHQKGRSALLWEYEPAQQEVDGVLFGQARARRVLRKACTNSCTPAASHGGAAGGQDFACASTFTYVGA